MKKSGMQQCLHWWTLGWFGRVKQLSVSSHFYSCPSVMPEMLFAFRSVVHEFMAASPAELLHDRICFPICLIKQVKSNQQSINNQIKWEGNLRTVWLIEHIVMFLNCLHSVQELAKANMHKAEAQAKGTMTKTVRYARSMRMTRFSLLQFATASIYLNYNGKAQQKLYGTTYSACIFSLAL